MSHQYGLGTNLSAWSQRRGRTFERLPPGVVEVAPSAQTVEGPPRPFGSCSRRLIRQSAAYAEAWTRSATEHILECVGCQRDRTGLRRPGNPEEAGVMRKIRLVVVSLLLLAIPSIVAARTPVDPATLTPPPPPEFNPVCEQVGNGIICEVAFTDPPIVDEPSGVICGTAELLFSQTRSVVGKRFYDADGLLLRRHAHDDITGTWTNPETGATASYAGGFMILHDLTVPGDLASGVTRSSGSLRIYVQGGGTILHNDAGRLVFDEATGTLLAQNGQHPFEDYFAHGDLSALDALCSALAE